MSRKSRYGLSVTVDFMMDLIAGPFDRESLRRLFALYQSWGVGRIDWLYTFPHDDGYYTNYWNYAGGVENACRTYEKIGEFLPAVVKVAHGLGMACHAVFKPFDRAFNYACFEPEEGKIGLTDIIGGGVGRATRSFLELQDCRMERNTIASPSGIERRAIAKIRLESEHDRAHGLSSDSLQIQISPDNDTYRPYGGPSRYDERRVRGRRVVELTGLQIPERYVALVTPFCEGEGRFVNTLDRLVRVFGPDGLEIPFTYGLQSNADRYRGWTTRRRHLGTKMADNVWKNGYIFDASGESIYDGFLQDRRWAIDGAPGALALAKGKARYAVALSPSHRQVRTLWLREIQECLDAGVDGVDIRIDNHARSQEWEAYGFEAPVARAYRRRWGTDPRRERYDARRLRALRAEHFTEFIRQASRQVRSAGSRFHAHVLSATMGRGAGQRYMGMKWEWEKWLDEGLLDGVTMKGLSPSPGEGQQLCDALTQRASRADADIWYVVNFNVLGGRPDWPQRFAQMAGYSMDAGHAGMNLYESAELAQKRGRRFHLHHPELPELLTRFRE